MSKLTEKKENLLSSLSVIKNLKQLAANPKSGLIETICLSVKLATFVYATIKEISIENKLEDVEKLIYIELRKTNNQSEANSNEGIG